MRYLMILLVIGVANLVSYSQIALKNAGTPISAESQANIEWVSSLYEHGIRNDGDTLFVSNEVQEILENDELRNFVFPENYTWVTTAFLLNKMELKKAFWFMINLYPDNKELVMKAILSYDAVFKMDEVLLSAFYTYAMIDPSVCVLENGRPKIKRPDIAEIKLTYVNEMINYINHYRGLASRD